MKRLILLSIIFSSGLYSQDYFIVNDGVKTKNYEYNVFINANIYSSDGIINNAAIDTKIKKQTNKIRKRDCFKNVNF